MTTLNLQVGTGNDDSHQESIANDSGRAVTSSGVCVLTATTFSPGSHSSGNEWTAAARFTGVTVANAATITTATFQLRCAGTYNASPNVVKFWVSAQAADNAGALTTTGGNLNTTARPRTTAVSAAWTQTSLTLDTWYSIDITTVIQEIVNRAGWASGNAIVVLVDTHADTTVSEWQDYYSYNGAAASAPKLDIDYTTGGAATSRPLFPARMPAAILAR